MTRLNGKSSIRKVLVLLMAVVVLTTVMAMPAFASGDPVGDGVYQLGANSGSKGFTSAWELSSADRYGSKLTYGYNTSMINEDYAWGNQPDLLHWAELRNDNGWHYGPYKTKNNVSKIEVTHSGSSGIQYYCVWN